MTNYDLKIEFTDPKDTYNSGDIIEGNITITNKQEKKGKPKPGKVKWVGIAFAENIPVKDDEPGKWTINYNNFSFNGKLVGKETKLSEWDSTTFSDNDPVTKPFKIKIPGGWKQNRGGQTPNLDWYVIMSVRLNSKLMGTPKFLGIVPVPNSDRSSTLV